MDVVVTSRLVAWPALLIALLIFGFAPGAVLRVIVLAFRRGDPRRTELLAELPHVPRLERPFWVCEQLEVALFEGLLGRIGDAARKRRAVLPVKKGKSRRTTDPWAMGVHRPVGGALNAYVRRPLDDLLTTVLDPAVRSSRLVVVRGSSSTGKSRAAYEAVTCQPRGWRLRYPRDAAALAALLDTGIPDRTILWLGELRNYTVGTGSETVMTRLRERLARDGCIAVTTMWPDHWQAYTHLDRAGLYGSDALRALLSELPILTGTDPRAIDPARGGVIDVPAGFTSGEMAAAIATGDPALAEIAAYMGSFGQVTQYLAGIPDLLDRYAAAYVDPYGQAVLAAAIDAVRLGHVGPLPAAFLLDAAVGYLTDAQRVHADATWGSSALAWACQKLNGAISALRPVPPLTGCGIAGYQLDDYLHRAGCQTRRNLPGPASLWEALIAHTTEPADLNRLGRSAQGYGLFRYAAALFTKGAAAGDIDGAARLLSLLKLVKPEDAGRATGWVATRIPSWNPDSTSTTSGDTSDSALDSNAPQHHPLGREPDGTSSRPWRWEEPKP